MRKTEFLTRLQASIAVLEDNEQKDILDEYSQHIDMKVKEGMSEAEAIDDFGPIDELIEEILGAYHVKAAAADVAAVQKKEHVTEQAASAVADVAKTGYTEVKGSVREFFTNAKEVTAGARASISSATDTLRDKWEVRRATRDTQPYQLQQSHQPHRPHRPIASKGVLGLLSGAASLTWRACKTACRWIWNTCVAMTAAALAAMALCLLFAFGFCLVFLLLGYPLAGVVIASLGGMVATLSLTGLVLMLIRRRPINKPPCEQRACTHTTQPTDESNPTTDVESEYDPNTATRPLETRPFESEAITHA
ncbi:DUF1700 domain-containing protein [Adlercreutzia sp. ZJ138]|uniref:DUF1700 domain-containing protein n=1 Tax=Adlercreutzia sp. ZJ138 TaxID=2709405 RepID=UPI0013EE358E|nr:DUF1700 domain-containing protein [Adlercreutzia sp. ZJ138]